MIKTFRPADEIFSLQWHFTLMGQLGFGNGPNSAGIERIWADYKGDGVSVGIWDDGIQWFHWDLRANYDATKHLVIDGAVNETQGMHGTRVSGIIAADDNGRGGVGVAPDASITGVRIFGDLPADRYMKTIDGLGNFDVTNHSYGEELPNFSPNPGVQKFEFAVQNGRDGLGTINVKGSTNSNFNGGGAALDASRFTLNVVALDQSGKAAGYSSYGSYVLVSAPSAAVTTDQLGTGAQDDYITNFGGVSAATPVVTGVVSLMLDANAGLGWRDVHNILSYSATGTSSLYSGETADSEDNNWGWNRANNWNGGGLHYSNDYGYGMVNAFNAVRMAEVWDRFAPAATSANEQTAASGTIVVNKSIHSSGTFNFSFNVKQNVSLEHAALTLDLDFPPGSALEITLISPGGTRIGVFDGSVQIPSEAFKYTFGMESLRGEMSAGKWTLRIVDHSDADPGKINSVAFTGFGTAPTNHDVYHYTDEVFAALSLDGQSARRTLADTDGGTDWINASAMVRDLVLDLNAGARSTADGTTFTTIAKGTNIENAIGGDGNDKLIGNTSANVLQGMRGNDILDGRSGVDIAVFEGKRADYVVTENSNGEYTVTHIVGTFGTDTLRHMELLRFDDLDLLLDLRVQTGDSKDNTLAGGAVRDRLFGLGGNDTLNGQAGNDYLDGGTGRDRMAGGEGDDIYVVDDAADRVTEILNAGIDVVMTSNRAHTLAAHVENLVYTGTAAFTGTGNNLANSLTGGNGADVLRGLGGKDSLYGLGGDDRFVFSSPAESMPGENMDVIFDFATGDRIDLRDIDANSLAKGNQAFNLVEAFTNARQQLMVTREDADCIISGDVNGDGLADFQIRILNTASLSAGDFFL